MLLLVSQYLLSPNASSWHAILVLVRGQPTHLIDTLKYAIHEEPCESAALIDLLVRAVVRYQEPALLEVLLEKRCCGTIVLLD